MNPTYAAAVESAATRAGDATLAAKMRTVAKQPTAVWMDRISAITGNADGNGLKFHLDNALAQKGSGPIVFNLVIYDLPGRDCFALASNGELPASDAGLARYKTEYIDAIAALLSDSKYANIRIVATIEPDSLPNLDDEPERGGLRAGRAGIYKAGVKYALDKLHAIPNVYNYIDIGHSGWLGWDSNAGPSATLFADVAKTTTAGFASHRRLRQRRGQLHPARRAVPAGLHDLGRWHADPVEPRSTSGTSTSTRPTTRRTCTAAHRRRVPVAIGMLIDTSRNGWGGPTVRRPRRPAPTTTPT